MAQFFINRPIFAWVIAALIMLAGFLSLQTLPVSAYPNIAPPQVTVSAFYPGASAQVLEDTVTSLIEDEMNGIDGLKYVKSESLRTGNATISLIFETGTDIDIAAVDVQNRIKRVEARLPDSVRTQGVEIDKTRPDFLMVVALYSPNGTHDRTDLGDFMDRAIVNDIRRVKGVGTVQVFGSKYAMRMWLDQKKMTSYGITPDEVLVAIQQQNAQLATGELGSLPSKGEQQINATVLVPSRLSEVDEFANIILRSSTEGALVRMKDIAYVERGASTYATSGFLNGQEAAAYAVKLTNDGNALETAELIKEKMTELESIFPDDVEWVMPYDTSIFVEVSIEEVFHTLLEAIVLVTIVMFVFLQSWRATIVPVIVVPISLIGTCIGLALFGFSINQLTMFAMVLVIGIVVDDAILVIENTERIMEEEGLGAYEATKKAMHQISGAVIGVTLALISVFIPMAFFSGTVGKIYQQFSLTIVVSVSFSAFLALSLTPAIAQGLLKAKKEGHDDSNPFFRWFNNSFSKMTGSYMGVAKRCFSKKGITVVMLAFVGICALVGLRFSQMPTGFLPSEDQGFALTSVLMPSGATEARTKEVTDKIDKWVREQPEVERIITVIGFSFFGQGQNTAISFVNFKPWDERADMRDADEFVADAAKEFQKYQEGAAFAFNLPPIPGLGNSNGFDFHLKDTSFQGLQTLYSGSAKIIGLATESGKFATIRPDTMPPAPVLTVSVDRVKARSLGVDIGNLNTTLQVALGSVYVNDYVESGKVHEVWVQANEETRSTPYEILRMQVRNNLGETVELAEIATAEWSEGPSKLTRYNGISSIPLTGEGVPGTSSGEIMNLMEEYTEQLPKGMSYEWSGQSLEEKIAGNQTAMLFSLSILVVFLVLAALYESWSLPVSVMLVVPLGVLGCILAMDLRGLPNDIYFKVGLITIIGLAAKNAIMIVEFARDQELEGKKPLEATIEACRLRFRPILMTSLAFTMGVVPLMISSGAGSASRNAIGTGVFGGMITATCLAIFFVPVFYLLMRKIFPSKLKNLESES
ncbi:multidrug efflux RND transporter permease subunit [Kangiella sp. TOML190]|uniref:multidrug efflux RND transporter permease subunit n=1 Tax=Kangiella sp. TOML190 TaxID=2931351 RepID=UPI00203C8FA7|nr:multidrug efflux RND transporter permease subunit [Kangiella sp. TOML190]